MKRVLLSIVVCMMFVATAVKADDQVVVAFSNRTMNGAYFSALSEYMKKFGEEKGYKIINTDAQGDFPKQLSDCEDLLSSDIDYLILNPQDPVASLKIVARANQKNIPVITIDSDIGMEADVVTRILPDNVGNNLAIGEYAAEVAAKDNAPINLALISGNQGNLVGRARRTNFILGILEYQVRNSNESAMKIVTQVWGGWDQQGGLKAMEDILVAFPDVNTVYAENDDMALGAYRALKAAGKTNDVKIYSYDGNKIAYKAIADGKLMATGENSPNKMATAAIDIISQIQAGKDQKTFPDYTVMPVLMVNKDNAEKVYDENSLF